MKPRSAATAHHDVKLSKRMSYILRHGAAKEGVTMTSDGFVNVSDLLQHPSFHGYTLADIEKCVQNNDKQRFALKNDGDIIFIRANQGHTLQAPELELTEVDPEVMPEAIHGTYKKCEDSIRQNGLSKMARTHIHMARDLPGSSGVISGMQSTCEVLVHVDIRRAARDGIKFYESANGVILSPGDETGHIPPKYCRISQRTVK